MIYKNPLNGARHSFSDEPCAFSAPLANSFAERPARIPILLLFIFIPTFSGCTYTYLDRSGTTHILGLTAVTVPSAVEVTKSGGLFVGVKNIGASVIRTDISSSISFGYNTDSLAVIRNNSCVSFAPFKTRLEKEKRE